ncbi:hypothetical protein ACOSP7_002262 [Xanthoceras sorbifolium]
MLKVLTAVRALEKLCEYASTGSEIFIYQILLGNVLAEKKIHLVYGGGNLGLMGRVSKAAYNGGSQVLCIM